jgi:hypothetical protein
MSLKFEENGQTFGFHEILAEEIVVLARRKEHRLDGNFELCPGCAFLCCTVLCGGLAIGMSVPGG